MQVSRWCDCPRYAVKIRIPECSCHAEKSNTNLVVREPFEIILLRESRMLM